MKSAVVSRRLPNLREPLWRSVQIHTRSTRVLYATLDRPYGVSFYPAFWRKRSRYQHRALKMFVEPIAKQFKIPRAQWSVRHSMRGYTAYIRVYRGRGTPPERALLRRVQQHVLRALGGV